VEGQPGNSDEPFYEDQDPDECADDYLRDFLQKIEEIAKTGRPQEWFLTLSEWYEETRWIRHRASLYADPDSDVDRQYHGISEGTRRRFDEDDWEYEAQSEPFDETQELLDLINDAQRALDSHETEELFRILESISDNLKLLDTEFFDSTNLDNWISLLDRSALQKDEDDADEKNIAELVRIAVQNLSVQLIRLIADDPRALRDIEWRQLEMLIATALEGLGFDIELTSSSKDGGKDVVATCIVNGNREVYLLEIKHWRSGKRVLSRDVIDFVEVNLREKSSGGIFVSTSGYSDSLFTCLSELRSANVRLGDSRKIVSLCRQFVTFRSGVWRPIVGKGSLIFEATSLPIVPKRTCDQPLQCTRKIEKRSDE